TFTTSEATSSFTTGDVTVSSGTLTGFGAVSSTIYTARLTATGNSTSSAIVAAAGGTFTDAAGNSNAANSLKIQVDTVAPTVAITSDDSLLNSTDTAHLTFT